MSIRILVPMIAMCAMTVAAAEKFSFNRPLMGTRFSIICHADGRTIATQAAADAFSIAEEINATASDYLPDSELSKLAAQRVGTPVPVSPMLYRLLDEARRLAEATGGAFDPTLGPLTRLWRESRLTGRLPAPERLLAARTAVGWRHFTLDSATRTVTLHRENMAFDLGGLAKGHAADRMLESLAAAGISQAMVAAGGDIRLGDPPPARDGWQVALQTFDPARADEILTLSNAAVSTSGDLYQAVEIDGILYSHILDPATGLGLTRRIAASVIADNATVSDPLATAACVIGPKSLVDLRKVHGVREIRLRTPAAPPRTAANPPRSSENLTPKDD